LRHKDTDHTDPTGRPHDIDKSVDREVRPFIAPTIVSLIANGLDATVHTFAAGEVLDVVHRIGLGRVDADRTELLRKHQAFGDVVDNENLCGALNIDE